MEMETWHIKLIKFRETVRKNMPVCEFVYKCVSAA